MSRDNGVCVPSPAYGRRLIATTIDDIASDSPTRTYASVPVSDADLSLGFRDISYARLAAAVDRTAYWLDEHLPASRNPSASSSSAYSPSPHSSSSPSPERYENLTDSTAIQTFAYYGPRDLRYIAFIVAAIKTGRRLLLTSIMGSLEAQVHIARAADCHIFLFATGGADVLPSHVRQIPSHVDSSISLTVSSFEDLFFPTNEGEDRRPYLYEKTWDEAKDDEIAIYHTSGSSGFPKLVVHTNAMLARLDTWNLLEDVDGMTTSREYYADKRMWVGMPIFHLAGTLLSLTAALFLRTTPTLTPPALLPSPSLFAAVRPHVDGILAPPALLEDLVRRPHLHAALRALRAIVFGGAPLSRAAGAFLAPLGSLRTCVGSTEGGFWPALRPPDRAWDHVAPHPAMGASFDDRADGLFELVVRRTPASERFTNFWDAVAGARLIGGAELDPAAEVFGTKDLWRPHPDPGMRALGAGLWKCVGRTDDLVVLSGEVKMHAGMVEERLRCHGLVKHALVGGYMRRVPFLLLEIVEGVGTGIEEERKRVLEDVWPAVEEANEDVGERGKLRRALTLVAVPEKPFVRLGKGTVDRRGTFAMYEREVDEMYEKFDIETSPLVTEL